MPAIAQAPGTRTRGGQGKLKFRFVVKDPITGLFSVPETGNDPTGNPYGTLHSLGSLTKTDWSYNDDNSVKVTTEAVEMDVAHRNLYNVIAPPLVNADKTPDLKLETGEKLEGESGGEGNLDKPFIEIFYFGQKIASKNQVLHAITQAVRSGGSSSDPDNWSKHKYEFSSVDGKGYESELPDDDDDFDNLTAVALSGNNRFGLWLAEAA
jgi:hypothetical protein